jgi:hypothetical protein
MTLKNISKMVLASVVALSFSVAAFAGDGNVAQQSSKGSSYCPKNGNCNGYRYNNGGNCNGNHYNNGGNCNGNHYNNGGNCNGNHYNNGNRNNNNNHNHNGNF